MTYSDLFFTLEGIDVFVNDFKKDILNSIYEKGAPFTPYFVSSRRYLSWMEDFIKLKELLEFLNVDESDIEKLEFAIRNLNNTSLLGKSEDFSFYCESLENILNEIKDGKITLLKIFDEIERKRLSEAIECLKNGCYYSSSVMAISALENRLIKLLKKQNPDAKINGKDISNATFGAVINDYIDGKSKYGDLIPDKHEHLLKLSNEYRIFCAHPKEEVISRGMAKIIVGLVFEFMTDGELIKKL